MLRKNFAVLSVCFAVSACGFAQPVGEFFGFEYDANGDLTSEDYTSYEDSIVVEAQGNRRRPALNASGGLGVIQQETGEVAPQLAPAQMSMPSAFPESLAAPAFPAQQVQAVSQMPPLPTVSPVDMSAAKASAARPVAPMNAGFPALAQIPPSPKIMPMGVQDQRVQNLRADLAMAQAKQGANIEQLQVPDFRQPLPAPVSRQVAASAPVALPVPAIMPEANLAPTTNVAALRPLNSAPIEKLPAMQPMPVRPVLAEGVRRAPVSMPEPVGFAQDAGSFEVASTNAYSLKPLASSSYAAKTGSITGGPIRGVKNAGQLRRHSAF